MIIKYVSNKVNKPDFKPILTTQNRLFNTWFINPFISEIDVKLRTIKKIISLIEKKTASYSIPNLLKCDSPKYWPIQREVFEKLDELCDDKLFWELNKSKPTDFFSSFVRTNITFFEYLLDLRKELFLSFLYSLNSRSSFFSKSVEFSSFQRLLVEKEQGCSKDEVEWLKLLSINHQMDWLMSVNWFKDEFKQECNEDLLCNLERWSNLFSKLDKVEREFKQKLYKFLVDKNRGGYELTCSYERITLILRHLQSLKNASLLNNMFLECKIFLRTYFFPELHLELDLANKHFAYRVDWSVPDIMINSLENNDVFKGSRYSLLCIYLYFLKKEKLLFEEIWSDFILINDFYSKQGLLTKIDKVNDLERFKVTTLTDFEKFDEYQNFHEYKDLPYSIDFVSSDLKRFFKDFEIDLDEEDLATTPDWEKLMQSVQTSCKAAYLYKLFSWGIFVWDSWDGYSLEVFESTGIKPTELGLNSYDEINLHRRDFLISSSQWSKNDIYKALETFQSIDSLDPKVINNPKVIALREKVPNFNKPEEILWWKRFQDCLLKYCNERLGFSIDDHIKTYGPEQARIDYCEEWGIQHGPLIAGSNLYDPVIVKEEKKEQYKTK